MNTFTNKYPKLNNGNTANILFQQKKQSLHMYNTPVPPQTPIPTTKHYTLCSTPALMSSSSASALTAYKTIQQQHPTPQHQPPQHQPQQQYQQKKDIEISIDKDGNEFLLFDPYNVHNPPHEITKEEIEEILRTHGIPFPINNILFYQRAFIHKSYLKKPQAEYDALHMVEAQPPTTSPPIRLHTKSNETLEYLGDGVLEFITKFYLYKKFPKEDEGFMTDMKIELVKNEAIGNFVLQMGLNKWYILSKQYNVLRAKEDKLGCLFEAFVGAIFLDFNKVPLEEETNKHWFLHMGPGIQVAQQFVECVFEKYVNQNKLILDVKQSKQNAKRILQEMIQSEFKTTPIYLPMAERNSNTGEYHEGVFLKLGVFKYHVSYKDAIHMNSFSSFSDVHQYMAVNKKVLLYLGEGRHVKKVKAEQIACEGALELLGKQFGI